MVLAYGQHRDLYHRRAQPGCCAPWLRSLLVRAGHRALSGDVDGRLPGTRSPRADGPNPANFADR